MACIYQPNQLNNSRIAFLELTRRVRDDLEGGIEPLNDALGKGIRLIMAHLVEKEDVEKASMRVIRLTARRLRSSEVAPEGVPGVVVSLIHQCSAGVPRKKPKSEMSAKKHLAVV